MIYIGIDNGLTGGLCVLGESGEILAKVIMPTREKSKGNELAANDLAAHFEVWRELYGPFSVIIETPGKFAKGVQAISSMWDSYGATRGVLEALKIRHHRIAPITWQKVMIPNCAKGDTKPAAKARVGQLWPDEKWLATPRSTKPHEGLIDAALIAEYGRRNNL